MNIDLKTKNINLDSSLRIFCQRVIGELEKFIRISKTEPNGWMEIEKTTRHHKKGPYFRAECQIFLPGRSLRAEATAKYLREAITQVKDEMQRQLKDYKNKLSTKQKRGQREFKKSLNFASAAKLRSRKGERIREESI